LTEVSRKYLLNFIIFLVSLTLFACAVKPKVSPIAKTITVFYTGDLNLNNIARIATYVKQERAKNPNLFIIDGKIFSDEPITVLNRGEAEISILQSAGIDGIVLTPDFLRFGTERAKELIDKVRFFFLAANLYQPERPRFFAQGYLIKAMAKTRVSLIGILFDSTDFYLKLPGIKRRDPVYIVKLFVPMQRMRQSDLVGLIVTSADSITFSDLDFVIGARTSKSITAPPCHKDESLRRLDLFLSSKNQIIDYNSSVVRITDSIIEDSLVKATFKMYQDRTDSMLETEITEGSKKLPYSDFPKIVQQAILYDTKADGFMFQTKLVKWPFYKDLKTRRSFFEALGYTGNLPVINLTGKEIEYLIHEMTAIIWSARLSEKNLSLTETYRIVTMPDLLQYDPKWANKGMALSDSTLISMVINYFKKGRQ
jgi:2',3'-cyclic-nucleotide 2'-phosphodiesterase (5'-nucleotidase family)